MIHVVELFAQAGGKGQRYEWMWRGESFPSPDVVAAAHARLLLKVAEDEASGLEPTPHIAMISGVAHT